MTNVSTRRYFTSHLREPRGRGYWMFETVAREIVVHHNGLYREAKKAADTWAKANGNVTLYVCP